MLTNPKREWGNWETDSTRYSKIIIISVHSTHQFYSVKFVFKMSERGVITQLLICS